MKNKFIEFLKENEAYEKFKTNLKEDRINIESKQATLKTVFEEHPLNYIEVGFVWHKTQEGYNFWHSLNKLWRVEYHKKLALDQSKSE